MGENRVYDGDSVFIPVEAATLFDAEDIIKVDGSGYGVKFTAEADAASFIGVADSPTIADDTDEVKVDIYGVFSFACDSADFIAGKDVKWAADKKVVACTTNENSIGKIWEGGTALTEVLVKIKTIWL